ncbi:hypothetical protein CEQ90_15810 [Lewinellaceae bacterium SD302]|nr:hypothetical protein CEQ90_15810 [Lewinellaceae bacterium SD302]
MLAEKLFISLFFLSVLCSGLSAQEDDLLSLLGESEPTLELAEAAFKTNRVINLHSIENTAAGVLDFKIGHRFGFLSGGFSELFGLDDASIRLGFDYGLTNRLQIGIGRSGFRKTYDAYGKFKLLRQSSGLRNFPITVAVLGTAAIQTLPWQNPDRENYFTSRLYYTGQLIMGRKISESISFQLSPTVIHRNLVRTSEESNDVLALGGAGRVKLSRRIALNAEYVYVLPGQLTPGFRNSLSVGVDIETGGHVFQLHFTNSTSMIEPGFITETVGSWANGDVHFGFNVSRVFTVRKPG